MLIVFFKKFLRFIFTTLCNETFKKQWQQRTFGLGGVPMSLCIFLKVGSVYYISMMLEMSKYWVVLHNQAVY